MFARGVILVEGDAEKFLLPALAKNQGYDLDELGVSICSVAGTNFYPYLVLLGPRGLNIPLSVLTDYDPRKPRNDGTPRSALGPGRVVNQMMRSLLDEKSWDTGSFEEILKIAPKNGIFMNTHTFEVDLFKCGLAGKFVEAMNGLSVGKQAQERMQAWAGDISDLDTDVFLRDIETVGKGRFAQRLASIILGSGIKKCPKYVLEGIEFVAERCRRG
jgi:putative ATP-dependent endonuclease of OLD family